MFNPIASYPADKRYLDSLEKRSFQVTGVYNGRIGIFEMDYTTMQDMLKSGEMSVVEIRQLNKCKLTRLTPIPVLESFI